MMIMMLMVVVRVMVTLRMKVMMTMVVMLSSLLLVLVPGAWCPVSANCWMLPDAPVVFCHVDIDIDGYLAAMM